MLQYLCLVLVILDQLLLLCALTFQDAVKRSDGLKQENSFHLKEQQILMAEDMNPDQSNVDQYTLTHPST